MYDSDDSTTLYQKKPVIHRPSRYKPKGWTETVEGYINEAKQLAKCLLRNCKLMKRPYTWAVHINMNVVLTPAEITALWKKTCRILRRNGIVALWVREINRANKIHYHLILKNQIDKKALERLIEEAMPSRKAYMWRKKVEPIKSQWYYPHYIVKARVGNYVSGRWMADLYSSKRLLFKPNLRLKKYHEIGDFWERPKKQLWKKIQKTERQIGEGLEQPNVRRLAEYVYDLVGEYVPLKQIERSFGAAADHPAVQEWINRLLADEWNGESD